MKLAICIDDKYGYSFNHRRQSKDKILRRHLLTKIIEKDEKLVMNEYSYKSFEKEDNLDKLFEQLVLCEEKLLEEKENWIFVENIDISEQIKEVDEIILYKWNMLYLSDLRIKKEIFDLFEVKEEEEFSGSSHNHMTYQYLIRKEETNA